MFWVTSVDAYSIDKLRPKLRGFHVLRRKFRPWRNEADPPRKALSGKAVRLNPRPHPERDFAHLRLGQIGTHPKWIVESERKHWRLRSGHIAGFQNAILNDAVRGCVELRIGQFFLRQS